MARTICLRLLTSAPKTRAQLEAALARRGVPERAAATVLDRFTDVGLIDDRAFAAAWVTSRHAGRGLARRALAHELHQRGVGAPEMEDALARIDGAQEAETARHLVRRRLSSMGRLAREVQERRLVGMLARKGYSPALALRVVREALEAEPDDLPRDLPDQHPRRSGDGGSA